MARLVLWPAGVAVGVFSVWLAGQDAGFSYTGGSPVAAIVELVAGWSAIAIGLISWRRRPRNRFGPLLTAAGFAWYAVEWQNPAIGSSIAFTLAIVFSAACPAILAHAILAYPSGRLSSLGEGLVITVAYAVNVGLLGFVPGLLSDPAWECPACPSYLLTVGANQTLSDDVVRLGLSLAIVWALLVILLAGRRLLLATSAARRLMAPVSVAGIAFLVLFVADVVHSLQRLILSNDETDLDLRFGQAAALVAIAVGVSLEWIRARRSREHVARLVLELGQAPPPGGLRDVLAQMLADPRLELAYPIGEGRFATADGRLADLSTKPERISTPVVRGGEVQAMLGHRPDLLDDPARVDAVITGARLALASERLQAESRAQLEDLRASRGRIVEAGDAARRRLERDLHDGAQQRLVSVSLGLRLIHGQLDQATDPAVATAISEAELELRSALRELRELAHGIYPAVLADEGLAAGIDALAEASTIPIEILDLPDARLDPRVEAAAYFVIAEATGRGHASRAKVSARSVDGHLVVEIEQDGPILDHVTVLEDRVGAIGGSLTIGQTAAGMLTILVEIPPPSDTPSSARRSSGPSDTGGPPA